MTPSPIAQAAVQPSVPVEFTLMGQWPYRLTIYLEVGDVNADEFAAMMDGLLEPAVMHLTCQHDRIAAAVRQGADQCAPTVRRPITYGHSADRTPMLLDIGIDPYAVSIELLRAKWPDIVSALSCAMKANAEYRQVVAAFARGE